MHAIEVNYQGGLRCSAIHLKSGNSILSDAPVDNKGKGEAFSPTDLLCTSLAMCMLTIMGIAAQEKEIAFENVCIEVTKIMGSEPRRVSGIQLKFNVPDLGWTEREWAIMKNAANTCPVAQSIHPSIQLEVTWTSHA
jgi:putative redox protein